jgi:hypothetical protein
VVVHALSFTRLPRRDRMEAVAPEVYLLVPIDCKSAQPNRLAGVPAFGRHCQF